MLLAGDVGGTKTLLGLFERAGQRPRPVTIHSYSTGRFTSFSEILDAFAQDVGHPFDVEAAAAGVAGPVAGNRARLTNIPWDVSASEMTARFGTTRARLLNDLEAMAASADLLTPDEFAVLQQGAARTDGNAAILAAGTGLGQAYLHRVDGRLRPMASEGGHADFAPRTDREVELWRMLHDEYGRAEVEHILCGPGLLNLHRFTHGRRECVAAARGPAAVSQAALSARCPMCVEALAIFVSVYGAEAGNLALRGVATSGVYIGGGMAPKILPAMRDGRFIEAFRAKGAMSALVAQVPVRVILNPEAALLGAAVCAQEMNPEP